MAKKVTWLLQDNLDMPYEEETKCHFQDLLQNIISIWNIGILLLLKSGKLRFSEIYRGLPGNISKRMLSKSLRSLEENGLVKRTIFPTKPPSVEYELTPLGISFLPTVIGLEQWAIQHEQEINASRKLFKKDHENPNVF